MRFPNRLGAIDKDATELLVLEAIEAGVNYFDTAYLYTGSEAVLGEILERDQLRERVFIATKLPHGKVRRAEDLDQLFGTSLERLRTDYIDYYLIHNVASCEQWERLVALGAVEWIERQKAAGAIREIGFSFHGAASEFEKMLAAYDWDFVQIQYNYVNEHYQAGRAGLKAAAAKGLPVIVMEPLLGGRLADKLPAEATRVLADAGAALADASRKSSGPGAGAASGGIAAVSGDANSAVERTSLTLDNAGWALKWLYDQPEVTVVLSGMNGSAQLAANCAVASATEPGSMTDSEHVAIERARTIFQEAFRIPCTGCNYCLPCPRGISIPALFAAYNESFAVDRFTGLFHYFTSAGAPDPNARLASDCVKCGACVKKCPQHIAIPDRLDDVRRRLQPPGTRMALEVYSKLAR